MYIGYVDDYVIIVSLAKKSRRCSLVPSLVKSLFPIQSQGDSNVYLYSREECTTAHMLSSPILPCGGKTKTGNPEAQSMTTSRRLHLVNRFMLVMYLPLN